MNRIVKSSAGEASGSKSNKPYSSGRYSSPSRKAGKRGGGGGGGGGGSGKFHKKKKFHRKDQHGKKEEKKDPGKKDDKGKDKPLSFASAFAQGVFSMLALSMIANAGLIASKAVAVAASPIAGRITRCLSAGAAVLDFEVDQMLAKTAIHAVESS